MRDHGVQLGRGECFATKTAAKCAVIVAAGIGRCAIAPSSQRAWALGGVPGRAAVVVPVVPDVLAEVRAALEQAAVALRIPAAASAAASVLCSWSLPQ